MDRRDDGALILRSALAMPEPAPRTGAWLHRWAVEAPDRVAVAERSGAGWREVSYAALLQQVRAVAGALLGRGMQPGARIAFLSGNGIDHLILSLAAQYVGIVSVPLAEQYATVPEAAGRLIHAVEKARPAAVFAADAGQLARALALPQLAGLEVFAVRTEQAGRPVSDFADLLRGDASVDIDAAHQAVTHDTVAKILFTSGSSSDPKGVVTTQGMMCINQAQVAAAWQFLDARPPRLLDWLPWNHVFGGSKNVNLILSHGGSLYIDSGKPTPAGFATTLDNIRDHAGTLSFNVPVAYAMLVAAAEQDAGLRKAFFGDLDLIFYAGASLPQPVWEKLEQFSLAETGRLPLMASSWGMTETAPACVMVHEPIGRSGVLGVPLPALEVKLIPDADMRCELRVRGPNVMRAYLDDAERTRDAFDDEGFLITGDAVLFVDPADPSRGLAFDGRISEDFKLATGTWVQAGRLRLDVLRELAGLAQDVVVCGHDRTEVGLMIFPLRSRVNGLAGSDGLIHDAALQGEIAAALGRMNRNATGSAKRITRAVVLAEPASVPEHEMTDKGSLNIRRILTRRAPLLDRLYDNDSAGLIRV
jgi:feruloyl-CoA synthase